MPFLRVIRDKRGYETTYLIHWYREGARQRSRILYVFRTPGGVRVGREPLDPDVMHELEARHPDIAFDWDTVSETRQVIDATPKPRWPRKRRDADDERPPATEAAVPAPAGGRQGGTTAAALPRPPVPSAIQGSTAEEQIAFLALWYSNLRDRILQRSSEPARREALLSLAERLNPAAWTDADEIAAGLPRAAEALERLSRVLSRRRRKPRRTPTRPEKPAPPAVGVESPAAGAAEPPAVTVAEAPATAEAPAQDESAPLGALTDTSPTGE